MSEQTDRIPSAGEESPRLSTRREIRSAELDRELAAVKARSQVKDELIRDLIDEKTTLREVSARFLAMNSECKGYMTGLRSRFAGLSDEELTARVVLESVDLFADTTAERKQVALARLSNEYTVAFGPSPTPDAGPRVAAGPRADVLQSDWRRFGARAVWRVGRRWARALEQNRDKFAGDGDARMAN